MQKSIINQMSDIIGKFHSDLLSSGTINDKGEVIKPQMFIDIIEHTEKELQKFEPEVEDEAGVVTDRYAADILSTYFYKLQRMKETMSLHPDQGPEDPKAIAIEERMMRPSRPSRFVIGIKKFFRKLHGKKTGKVTTNGR